MNKEEEKRMLKIHLRTFRRRCNMILNQLDLVKRGMGALDLLEELDIDKEVKSGLISDLKSYDKRIREMKEELDDLTEDNSSKGNEEMYLEVKVDRLELGEETFESTDIISVSEEKAKELIEEEKASPIEVKELDDLVGTLRE